MLSFECFLSAQGSTAFLFATEWQKARRYTSHYTRHQRQNTAANNPSYHPVLFKSGVQPTALQRFASQIRRHSKIELNDMDQIRPDIFPNLTSKRSLLKRHPD